MDTFNFENKITTLSLPVLKNTLRAEMAMGGLPKNRPIEHYKLIENVCQNVIDNTEITPKIDVIYASEKEAKRFLHNPEDGPCPIEKYLLERITTKILIADKDKETKAAIGISYSDLGIQLVFGTHVNVCSNLMVFGSNFISTYGKNKVEFNIMMDVFDDWMRRFQEKREKDLHIIKALKRERVEENEMFEILGRLIHSAEKNNLCKSDESSLNVSQTLRLIDNYENRDLTKTKITAWDIVNWGTNNLKPEENAKDLTTIYPTTYKFTNAIAKHFIGEMIDN